MGKETRKYTSLRATIRSMRRTRRRGWGCKKGRNLSNSRHSQPCKHTDQSAIHPTDGSTDQWTGSQTNNNNNNNQHQQRPHTAPGTALSTIYPSQTRRSERERERERE